MSAAHDRGLRAVARVRALHEKGRRLELAQANRAVAVAHEVADHAREYRGIVADQAVPRTAGAFSIRQAQFEGAVEATHAARDLCEQAEASSYESQQEWSAAKSDLSAIENLLQRRADERAAEQRRAEAREADELSQRHRTAFGSGPR